MGVCSASAQNAFFFVKKDILKRVGLLPFVRLAITGALGGYQSPQFAIDIRHVVNMTYAE